MHDAPQGCGYNVYEASSNKSGACVISLRPYGVALECAEEQITQPTALASPVNGAKKNELAQLPARARFDIRFVSLIIASGNRPRRQLPAISIIQVETLLASVGLPSHRGVPIWAGVLFVVTTSQY